MGDGSEKVIKEHQNNNLNWYNKSPGFKILLKLKCQSLLDLSLINSKSYLNGTIR